MMIKENKTYTAILLATAIPWAIFFNSIKTAGQLTIVGFFLLHGILCALFKNSDWRCNVTCLSLSAFFWVSMVASSYRLFMFLSPKGDHPVMPIAEIFYGFLVGTSLSFLLTMLYFFKWERYMKIEANIMHIIGIVLFAVFVVDFVH